MKEANLLWLGCSFLFQQQDRQQQQQQQHQQQRCLFFKKFLFIVLLVLTSSISSSSSLCFQSQRLCPTTATRRRTTTTTAVSTKLYTTGSNNQDDDDDDEKSESSSNQSYWRWCSETRWWNNKKKNKKDHPLDFMLQLGPNNSLRRNEHVLSSMPAVSSARKQKSESLLLSFWSESKHGKNKLQNRAAKAAETTTTTVMKPAQTNALSSPPTYRQLMLFCFTTVLIWLTEPLLSLVDTTVVGWSGATTTVAAGAVRRATASATRTITAASAATASTSTSTVLQLAALGPATTLYDSWLYLTYFLSMATTHKLTSARARGNVRACLQTCSHVLGVAVVLGAITTMVMWLGAESFLTIMTGAASSSMASSSSSTTASVAALIPLATRYVHIRATVAMASIVGMVCQSICLSVLDTQTPIRAVVAASLVNVVGDVALRHAGMQGVAWATAASSLVSCLVLSRAVRQQCRSWKQELQLEQQQQQQTERQSQPQPKQRLGAVHKTPEHQVNGDHARVVQGEENAPIESCEPVSSDEALLPPALDLMVSTSNQIMMNDTTNSSIWKTSAGAVLRKSINNDTICVDITQLQVLNTAPGKKMALESMPANHYKVADFSSNAPVSSNHILAPTPTATEQTPAVVTKRKNKDDNIPLLSLPDRQSLFELLRLSGPIFFVILAKISCYSAVTLRTTQFGVVTLATHNVMMRIFFLFGTFGDALSQTAQSFLPAALYPKPRPNMVRSVLRRMALITAVIAILNSQFSLWLLYHCGPLLTKDASIVQGMRGAHTQFMGLSMLVHPFSLLLEGTVLSLKQFPTLVWTYIGTMALHFSVLSMFCTNFGAVWRTFFLFQFIRLANFSWQVWRRRQQTFGLQGSNT